LPGRDVLLALTFGIVLFTILAQGLTIRPLLERLDVGGEDGTPRDVELALGRLHTVEGAAREVASLRRAHALDEHLARQLLERYAAQGVASPIRNMLTLRSYHGSSVAPTTEVGWLR
jgi:CPA1 family monovalent cation:H+ antiporter